MVIPFESRGYVSYSGKKSGINRYAALKAKRAAEFRKERLEVLGIVIFSLILILFVLLIGVKLTARSASAENAAVSSGQKYYKSISVERGETLWSIADKEMGAGWSDVRDYINEVKQINNLDDDKIMAGGYICLPYYT